MQKDRHIGVQPYIATDKQIIISYSVYNNHKPYDYMYKNIASYNMTKQVKTLASY